MKTSKEYYQTLKSMKPNVYVGGEEIGRDDPRLLPGINVISHTYDLATNPKYEKLLTATSHLTGEKINRFCNIHHSVDDLLKKQEMTRTLCRMVGGCIQRCMGIDAMNALSVVTYGVDKKFGTDYNKRYLKYLDYFQKNDIAANCAQTDVKGDRSKRPHEQKDPDLYLRVVERRRDGIVVRGAKAHNTIAGYAEEIIVTPTRFLTPEEKDWAVAFAIPADWDNVHLVCRVTNPRERKKLDAPIAHLGDVESLTIFDDAFIPNDRVFLNGETEAAGILALLFALFHRHSYTGCKPAIGDITMGYTALVAEYNGVEDAKHVQAKLADLISTTELVFASGIAAAHTSTKDASGTYIPNTIYCNVGRRHAGMNTYHEAEILADIAGGLAATLPYEEDFYHPKVGPLLNKYIMRKPDVPAENIHRCYRAIGDAICSGLAGVMQIAGVHGGGSPVMEEIAILKQYDIKQRKEIAKYLSGIRKDFPI
ncbi:MAG: 4-hydroxyphenylacetate 3-hydroxylase N-terminal domain-containing protein [Promethearchaeati archaeon SRVP18_Atabeyarchaeia-1]